MHTSFDISVESQKAYKMQETN